MPTVYRSGPFRFFFYAGDRDEPPHVHVEGGAGIAKYWLNPVRLEDSRGFKRHELNVLEALVSENSDDFLQAWNEYFNQ
jgi:hypothetical protein